MPTTEEVIKQLLAQSAESKAMFDQAIAGELAAQQQASSEFQAQAAALQKQFEQARDEIISSKQKKEELPPGLADIVTLLKQNPLMIPACRRWIDGKIDELRKVIGDVLGEPQEPTA